MTQARLERLCTTWKKRLRLQDWDVAVTLVDELPEVGLCGHVFWDVLNLGADIKVVNEECAEATLVHELLHLRLLPFGVDDTDEKQAAMNLLTDSLLQAYGKSK